MNADQAFAFTNTLLKQGSIPSQEIFFSIFQMALQRPFLAFFTIILLVFNNEGKQFLPFNSLFLNYIRKIPTAGIEPGTFASRMKWQPPPFSDEIGRNFKRTISSPKINLPGQDTFDPWGGK